jgi:glycosyltransferase involved in cell wall biosynthesis
MNKVMAKIIFFNQAVGSLFQEVIEDLASATKIQCVLLTGNPSRLDFPVFLDIKIVSATSYTNTSTFNRIRSWTCYAFNFLTFCLGKVTKEDILFVTSNPPINGFLALFIHNLFKVPYVMLIYDIYPDVLIQFKFVKQFSLIIKIWHILNKFSLENASAVITLGNQMAHTLAQQFDVENAKTPGIFVIPPQVDTQVIKPIAKDKNPFLKKLNLLDKLIVMYSGNFGVSHNIEVILEACQRLKDMRSIHFLLIGKGAKWNEAKQYQHDHHLENLDVLPYLPESDYIYSITAADIALVSLELNADGLMLPGKTYPSMAAGSAIIGICGPKNDLRQTITEHRCGLCVEPDTSQLVDAIRYLANSSLLLQELKENSRYAAEHYFSRQVHKDSFFKMMKKVNLI